MKQNGPAARMGSGQALYALELDGPVLPLNALRLMATLRVTQSAQLTAVMAVHGATAAFNTPGPSSEAHVDTPKAEDTAADGARWAAMGVTVHEAQTLQRPGPLDGRAIRFAECCGDGWTWRTAPVT